jgi:Trm5-related predicted tRNA methylase
VYIIGGIADNADAMKGTTYNWAVSKGFQTAKFPIDKYISVKRRNVLNVNHVFEIMMKVANDGDWKKALDEMMPDRLKRKD